MIRPSWLREPEGRFEQNPREPNPAIQAVAQRYVKQVGLPPIQPTPYVNVDPKVAREIANIFDQTPDQSSDPDVQMAYGALVEEVSLQLQVLPVQLEPYGDEEPAPYRDSADMMEDVRRGHLFVYEGGEDHALLTRKENFAFRAVHDVFGHAAGGFSFGPHGEENAWISHLKMFTPMARAALTTETRAQNSWVNFFDDHDKLPPQQRPYAEQKTMILPVKYRTHRVLREAYREFPGFIE